MLGDGDSESLSESVERHLQRYFDLHGRHAAAIGALCSESCARSNMPLIEIALDATGGNQAKCADLVGYKPKYFA